MGGGAPGGLVVGGGLGGIVILILTLLFNGVFGGNDGSTAGLDPTQVGAAGSEDPNAFAQCKTGADANANAECRVIGTVNSRAGLLGVRGCPSFGKEWQPTKTVLYDGQTQSACGTASNQVGPFYCPLDKRVYIDASFFQILQDQFGSSGGPLAQEYVVAHEYGHALQDQLGLLDRRSRTRRAPKSGGVQDRADGRLPRRGLGQARLDGQRPEERYAVPQAADRPGHQGRALGRLVGRRRPHPAGHAGPGQPRDAGRTAPPRPASGGSCRATRPATSTSATPSRPPRSS